MRQPNAQPPSNEKTKNVREKKRMDFYFNLGLVIYVCLFSHQKSANVYMPFDSREYQRGKSVLYCFPSFPHKKIGERKTFSVGKDLGDTKKKKSEQSIFGRPPTIKQKKSWDVRKKMGKKGWIFILTLSWRFTFAFSSFKLHLFMLKKKHHT